MAKNVASKYRKTSIENDVDAEKNLKYLKVPKDAQSIPVIKSEAEYSQNAEKTRDVGTELAIETDDVNVTTEIYSQTDLPSHLRSNEVTQPKPGTIVPEYHDGRCMILRAYRCKCTNTVESYDPLHPIKCIFPPIEVQEDFTHLKRNFEEENVHMFRLTTTFPCVRKEITQIHPNKPQCPHSCSNLIVNESSQTDDSLTICKKPEDQGDTAIISESIDVSVRHETYRTNDMDSLTTIQEGSEDRETVEGQSETETEETEIIREKSHEGTEEEEITEGTEKIEDSVTASEMTIDQYESFSEDGAEEVTIKIHNTNDAATSESDLYTTKETKRKVRKSSTSIFEMGTMLTSHSSTWVDKPRRQGSCKLFSTRTTENCYCNARKSDSRNHNMRLPQPVLSHCMVQCEIAQNNERTCSLVDNRRMPSESAQYYSNHCFDSATYHTNHCFDSVSDGSRELKNFWPTENYRTARSRQDFSPYREPLMRHQLCSINNRQGYSMVRGALENFRQNSSNRNNACNQYYLNLNKAYNMAGRYCLCNNGYNIPDANAYCYAATSRVTYHSPTRYHYSFNAWC